jgi:hypothetical protein
MTLQVSTKFKERILGRESFEDIFNGGRILIYSGAQPGSADMPATGTLLGQVTANGATWYPNGAGGGLTFTRSGAFVAKSVAQTWLLEHQAAGVPGWFRLVGPDVDDGGLSYAVPRLDGGVGNTGLAQLVLSNLSFTPGTVVPIQQFLYTIPPILGA